MMCRFHHSTVEKKISMPLFNTCIAEKDLIILDLLKCDSETVQKSHKVPTCFSG